MNRRIFSHRVQRQIDTILYDVCVNFGKKRFEGNIFSCECTYLEFIIGEQTPRYAVVAINWEVGQFTGHPTPVKTETRAKQVVKK